MIYDVQIKILLLWQQTTQLWKGHIIKLWNIIELDAKMEEIKEPDDVEISEI